MDPGTVEYRYLYEQMNGDSDMYTRRSADYDRPINGGLGGCVGCILLNLLLNLCCCGGC